jgi:hypothetical protein
MMFDTCSEVDYSFNQSQIIFNFQNPLIKSENENYI